MVYRLELLDELRALCLTTGKLRLEGRYLRLERRYLRLERCCPRLERSNLGAQDLVLGFGLSHFYRCIDERFNERLVCRAKARGFNARARLARLLGCGAISGRPALGHRSRLAFAAPCCHIRVNAPV